MKRKQKRKKKDRSSHLLVLLVVVAALSAIGAFAWRHVGSGFPRLTVTVNNPLHQSDVPLSGRFAVHDAKLAAAMRQEIRELPELPQGIYNCPADAGVSYGLVFADGLQVEIKEAGCQEVTRNDTATVYTLMFGGTGVDQLQANLQAVTGRN